MTWKDVLFPRPLPGVVMWMAIASIATCWSMRGGEQPRLARWLPAAKTHDIAVQRPDSTVVDARTDEQPRVVDRTPRESEDRTHGVAVFVIQHMKPDDAFQLGDTYEEKSQSTTEVRRELTPDGGLRIHVRTYDDFSSRVLEIDLDPVLGAAPRARAIVADSRDAGPPFESRWGDVSGRIRLNTADWRTKDPFLVEWTLHGLASGERVCSHGSVELNR